MDRIVGIGEYAISDNEEDTIKTFALGSCVAVTVFSPLIKVAGMVHIALPYSVLPNEDKLKPCYYATSAVPFLINKICSEFGCLKGELSISIFGGAESLRKDDIFKIGNRNIEVVRKMLNDLNLVYDHSKIGGRLSRTLEMSVSTGIVKVDEQSMII